LRYVKFENIYSYENIENYASWASGWVICPRGLIFTHLVHAQNMLLGADTSHLPCIYISNIEKLMIVVTRNTFYGTRYLSHCCVLFCIKMLFLKHL